MTTTLENIRNSASALLSQASPPPVELRKVLLDIDEFINSADFQALETEQKSSIQGLRKDIKALMRQMENGDASEAVENRSSRYPIDNQTPDSASPSPLPAVAEPPTGPRSSARSHDPAAEEQMEEAEKLFYSGRYAQSVKQFDRVLQLEPKWERARQHRTEAETYLRTGYIPPVALPPEAATAFGKAQSAARVGRYADALTLLGKAQAVLRDVGIQRWQEGMEFEQKLQENIDAENTYQEGLKLFDQGNLDDAIERIETASRATGLPKYGDKGQEFRRLKENIRALHETLSSLTVEPKAISQAKADLDLLTAQYGNNPTLERLRTRLETTIPRVVAPLKDQIRSLKAQADRAETLDETLYLAKQARSGLEQVRNLEGLDESLDSLQNEVNRLVRETEKLEQDLAQAAAAYQNNKRWPVSASRLSQDVRLRYPNDPTVIQLNRSLGRYHAMRGIIRFGWILGGILILAILAWWGVGRLKVYQLSLTPTATGTPTNTPTSTITPTITSTTTATPTDTPTVTPTATPLFGVALRDIWARNGCYESFTAVGRIPAGGKLYFLLADRRFDLLNRECLLVEYRGTDRSVIGWVLLMDIGKPGQAIPTQTPTP